jgi:hypothetical protein
VANDGKPGQHRRMKFLIEQPVADDMLNVVTHLRQHEHGKISAIIWMMQRGESDTAGCYFHR